MAQLAGGAGEAAIGVVVQRPPVIIGQRAVALGTPAFPGDAGLLDAGVGVCVQAVLALALEQLLHHVNGTADVVPPQVRIHAAQPGGSIASSLYCVAVGSAVVHSLFVL